MRTVVLSSILTTVCLFPLVAEEPVDGFQLSREAQLRFALLGSYETHPGNSPMSDGETVSAGIKNPKLGALFSAVIPGAGEFYGGSWLKGAAFLGVEIALWAGYAHFSGKGQDWDDRFHVYATTHWSEPRYWVGVASEAGVSGVTVDTYPDYLVQLREYERANHSHGLHVEKDQQYYEMIGKYDQFRYGWDDWHPGDPPLTTNRDWYETMRDKSNREFKKASTCAMVALANHLVSSLDAAWTISKNNRKIQTAIRFEMKPVRDELTPFYGLNVTW